MAVGTVSLVRVRDAFFCRVGDGVEDFGLDLIRFGFVGADFGRAAVAPIIGAACGTGSAKEPCRIAFNETDTDGDDFCHPGHFA